MFDFILNSVLLILCTERTYNFSGRAMRAALRVSTKLTSSYDDYYIKFNPTLFSRSCNFEDAGAFHSSLNIHSYKACFFNTNHSFRAQDRSTRHQTPCQFLMLPTCITPFAFTGSIGDMLLLLLFMPYLSETRNLLEISVNTEVARGFVEGLACESRRENKGLITFTLL